MARWPNNISKLTFGGSLPRTDKWSMGIYLDDSGRDIGAGTSEAPELLEQIATIIQGWFQRPASGISSVARLQWVKLNQIGPDGKYKNPKTNEVFLQGGTGFAGGAPSPWWQHYSVAITHRANETRGPAVAGRVYPPAVYVAPTETGSIPTAWAEAYASSYVRMLNEIQAAVPGEVAGRPLIVSSGTKLAPNVGTARPISRVEVGDVPDVQQRRRNALPENYIPANTLLVGSDLGAIG